MTNSRSVLSRSCPMSRESPRMVGWRGSLVNRPEYSVQQWVIGVGRNEALPSPIVALPDGSSTSSCRRSNCVLLAWTSSSTQSAPSSPAISAAASHLLLLKALKLPHPDALSEPTSLTRASHGFHNARTSSIVRCRSGVHSTCGPRCGRTSASPSGPGAPAGRLRLASLAWPGAQRILQKGGG